jgi:hypothetical protein
MSQMTTKPNEDFWEEIDTTRFSDCDYDVAYSSDNGKQLKVKLDWWKYVIIVVGIDVGLIIAGFVGWSL